MFTGIGAGRSRVRGFADHPADLAVTDRPRRVARKGEVGREDEVPLHFFVDELVFVMIEPDVVACAFYVIGLGSLIIGGVSGQLRVSDIHMVIEDPYRMLCHNGTGCKEAGEEKDDRGAETRSVVKKEECCVHMFERFFTDNKIPAGIPGIFFRKPSSPGHRRG